MKPRHGREDAPRVVAVALALWGAGVTLAAVEGVFAKLSPAALLALVFFIHACALGAYVLDPVVRAVANGASLRVKIAVCVALDLMVALVAIAAGNLAAFPAAFIALYVAPLALVATLEALRAGLARARLRSAAGTSPGARPAAS